MSYICTQNTLIFISERFLKIKPKSQENIEKTNIYCQYGGHVYPIASPKNFSTIYFSNEDIEEIVHKGFINEAEKSYVCLAKEELVVNKGLISLSTLEKR